MLFPSSRYLINQFLNPFVEVTAFCTEFGNANFFGNKFTSLGLIVIVMILHVSFNSFYYSLTWSCFWTVIHKFWVPHCSEFCFQGFNVLINVLIHFLQIVQATKDQGFIFMKLDVWNESVCPSQSM